MNAVTAVWVDADVSRGLEPFPGVPGGPRHIALDVTDIQGVFEHLKRQPDVQRHNASAAYGVQWEMMQGRPFGYGLEIAG